MACACETIHTNLQGPQHQSTRERLTALAQKAIQRIKSLPRAPGVSGAFGILPDRYRLCFSFPSLSGRVTFRFPPGVGEMDRLTLPRMSRIVPHKCGELKCSH